MPLHGKIKHFLILIITRYLPYQLSEAQGKAYYFRLKSQIFLVNVQDVLHLLIHVRMFLLYNALF